MRIAKGRVAPLGDHYCIEGELGEGGMATVYLAEDLRRDRAGEGFFVKLSYLFRM